MVASGTGDSYLWGNSSETTSSILVNPVITTVYPVKVTTAFGCVDSSFATAIINPLPVVQLTNNTSICLGSQALLTASGGISYLWSTSETAPTIAVTPVNQLTTYSVIVTDNNNCVDSASVDVTTVPLPVPTISNEIDTLCKGVFTTITAGGGDLYQWNTGEITPTIYVRPLATFVYSVTVSNILNNVVCSQDTSIEQLVRNCNVIYVPNSFSPMGVNAVFKPIGDIVITKTYHFAIYNRWGQMVFETNDINQGWDGKFNGEYVQFGAYVYYLLIDNGLEEPFEKVGTVTVIQ
jgi:gliding motility-associated-like protein